MIVLWAAFGYLLIFFQLLRIGNSYAILLTAHQPISPLAEWIVVGAWIIIFVIPG